MLNQNNKVCVIIPVHSAQPSAEELLAFRQCFEILGNHPIKILAPAALNLDAYKSEVTTFEVIQIDPFWLSSVQCYNLLKINALFYKLCIEYEFVLTYELDAYVFRDELPQWCQKGYDYIGAPWFDGWHEQQENKTIIGVGNSGFSLRNVGKASQLLKRIQHLQWLYRITGSKGGKANRKFLWLLKIFAGYFNIKSTQQLHLLLKPEPINEDDFWCNIVNNVFNDFKLAPVADAIRFSFEAHPSTLYEQNQQQLPFGCHAWKRYDPLFWKAFIPYKN